MGYMEIILLQDVEHLGGAGEVVRVRRGYGRNFLIPEGKAEQVSRARLARVEALKRRAENMRAAALKAAQDLAAQIEGKSVTISAKVGEESKLYGSVTTADVARAMKDQLGLALDRRNITLTDSPIRLAGEHAGTVKTYTGVLANFTVNVVPE